MENPIATVGDPTQPLAVETLIKAAQELRIRTAGFDLVGVEYRLTNRQIEDMGAALVATADPGGALPFVQAAAAYPGGTRPFATFRGWPLRHGGGYLLAATEHGSEYRVDILSR